MFCESISVFSNLVLLQQFLTLLYNKYFYQAVSTGLFLMFMFQVYFLQKKVCVLFWANIPPAANWFSEDIGSIQWFLYNCRVRTRGRKEREKAGMVTRTAYG